MSQLTLKQLIEFSNNLPGEYTIEYVDHKGISHTITDKLEVDLSNEKLILKS